MPYTVKEPYLKAARETTTEQMIEWMEVLAEDSDVVYDPAYHAIRIMLDERLQAEAHPEPYPTLDDALHHE